MTKDNKKKLASIFINTHCFCSFSKQSEIHNASLTLVLIMILSLVLKDLNSTNLSSITDQLFHLGSFGILLFCTVKFRGLP